MPNFSYSSAWLVDKGKIKIISQLEFKKMHKVSKTYSKNYTCAEINYLKFNAEYGISDQKSLLGEINFSTFHTYKYSIENKQKYYVVDKKSQRFLTIPNKFDSFSIGIKSKILDQKAFVLSHNINMRMFSKSSGEKFELNYNISYGKDLFIFKRDFFIQAEYLFNYNPFFYNYDNKLAFSLGYKKSAKKIYVLYLERHYKTNYYDKFLHKKVKLEEKFNETRIQLATITHINKKISFQKSMFTTINRDKLFISSGINIGLLFNL